MLPQDIYEYITTFFPIRDFLGLRLVSKDFCKATQTYNRTIIVKKHSEIRQLNHCFPKAKRMPINFTEKNGVLTDNAVDDFIRLKELVIYKDTPLTEQSLSKVPYLERLSLNHFTTVSMKPLPQLRELCLYHTYVKDLSSLNKLESLVLNHCEAGPLHCLTQLKSLRLELSLIKDEDIFGMPIEELTLMNANSISSVGIRSLRQLKRLYVAKGNLLDDSAIKDSAIEELCVYSDNNITSEGIHSLKHLRKLQINLKYIPINLKGLHYLEEISLGGAIITDCSDFERVSFLTLRRCTILGDQFETWKNLEELLILDTKVLYRESFEKADFSHIKRVQVFGLF